MEDVSTDSASGTIQAEVNSTVEQEAPVSQETEVQSSTEAPGQSEETFFDPKALPEELVPVYKSMQSAFTKKTQEIAAIRKEHEALKAQSEKYGKYEQYIPIVEEMLSANNQAQVNNPELEAFKQDLRNKGWDENAIELAAMGAQFTINQFNKQMSTQKQQEEAAKAQAAFEAGVNEAESLDQRLNDDSLTYTLEDGSTVTFGEMVKDFVVAQKYWEKDPVAATKRAIARVDALIGKAKTEGKEELSAAARAKATRFAPVNTSNQSVVNNQQPASIHEAAKMAAEELNMKL